MDILFMIAIEILKVIAREVRCVFCKTYRKIPINVLEKKTKKATKNEKNHPTPQTYLVVQ
ncbi:hypothetical protein BTT_60330 (plasmid) [Bacillus thuringiensis serovar morrisoni str. 4AA1]|nr:hypothetical protein BTT_60330 [Bacillus thuringiensis serovar morrisoni str. 4AA1]